MSDLAVAPRDLLLQLQRPSRTHSPLLVDLRSQRQFSRARITGSHNIPAARLISDECPDRDLILIAERDSQAQAVAERLHNDGFHRRIQHLQGGLAAWREAGLNLEASAEEAFGDRGIWPLKGLTMQRASRQLQRRSTQ